MRKQHSLWGFVALISAGIVLILIGLSSPAYGGWGARVPENRFPDWQCYNHVLMSYDAGPGGMYGRGGGGLLVFENGNQFYPRAGRTKDFTQYVGSQLRVCSRTITGKKFYSVDGDAMYVPGFVKKEPDPSYYLPANRR